MTDAPNPQEIQAQPGAHYWLTIGERRWCIACDSFQVRTFQRGYFRWSDTTVGLYPLYSRTKTYIPHANHPNQMRAHRPATPQPTNEDNAKLR
jgi:hypothetical protein